jgi:hypothetical protein
MPPISTWLRLDDGWNTYRFSVRIYIHIFFGRCVAEINQRIKWQGGGSVRFLTHVSHLLGAYCEVAPRFVCQGFWCLKTEKFSFLSFFPPLACLSWCIASPSKSPFFR